MSEEQISIFTNIGRVKGRIEWVIRDFESVFLNLKYVKEGSNKNQLLSQPFKFKTETAINEFSFRIGIVNNHQEGKRVYIYIACKEIIITAHP